MKLLLDQREGSGAVYASLAEKAARRAEDMTAWNMAQAYWSIAAEWYRQADDQAAERSAWEQLAESLVKQSEASTIGPKPSYLAAKTHLQQAIVVYRNRIGKAEAAARIEELHQRLLDYGERTEDEMTSFEARADIMQLVEAAQESVKGKGIDEALQALALLGDGEMPQHAAELRKRVLDLARDFPLEHLLEEQILSSDGRVLARTPSTLSADPLEQELAIRHRMFMQAVRGQHLHAEAQVEPARYQIILEHSVRIDHLMPIVANNPFVPPVRALIFARGLYAGLIGDWLVAAHLLVPQLENAIRIQLQRRGKITSNLTSQGIQEQYTLTKLFEQRYADIVEFLGEDLTFDLQGLLVEITGSNVRNDVSHGLVDEAAFASRTICYLWWIALHICYRFKMVMEQLWSETNRQDTRSINVSH